VPPFWGVPESDELLGEEPPVQAERSNAATLTPTNANVLRRLATRVERPTLSALAGLVSAVMLVLLLVGSDHSDSGELSERAHRRILEISLVDRDPLV
jgi:hypothetical protein